MSEPGLYIVATPIGNLEDISSRARRVLSEAQLVVAEDTRRTRLLLEHCGIRAPLRSLHEHNEEEIVPQLLDLLAEGKAVALVSDAGTPLISDPGYRLVRAAREQGLPVWAIPGPSAITAALSVAGLPTDRFVFEGFLPARAAARRKRLEELAGEHRTLVFFESSHRVQATLSDLARVFGTDRFAAVCRELTKQFETVLRGSLGELVQILEADTDQRKGEFVLLVEGRLLSDRKEASLEQAVSMARVLLDFLPASQAARAAAKLAGASRRDVFKCLENAKK